MCNSIEYTGNILIPNSLDLSFPILIEQFDSASKIYLSDSDEKLLLTTGGLPTCAAGQGRPVICILCCIKYNRGS